MPNKSLDGSDKSRKRNPVQESPLYDFMRRQAEGQSSTGSSSEGIDPRRGPREPRGSSTVEHGDGTANEAVVPVSEQQYREVMSQS